MAHVRLFLLVFLSNASTAFAGGIAVRFGPPAMGSGGPNPLSIPPATHDLGVSYVTDKAIEYNISATGLAIAAREKVKWGGYTSLGAGFAWSVNGGGLGPYAAVGLEVGCGGWLGCFSMEFSQALGIGFGHLASPSAVRVGLIKWF